MQWPVLISGMDGDPVFFHSSHEPNHGLARLSANTFSSRDRIAHQPAHSLHRGASCATERGVLPHLVPLALHWLP
jgi:hypothetical protein